MKNSHLNLDRNMRRLLTGIAGGQKGQALAYVLILLTFGMLTVTGFLSYTSTTIRVGDKDADRLLARYAAEDGITEVISDLIQGEDALSPGYTVPTPTVNDYAVNIAVNTPASGTGPAAIYEYLDPGVGYGLQSLASQESYYLRIDNVRAGSDIRVNWAFTPGNQRWKVKLYEGAGPPEAPDPILIAAEDFESGGWTGGSGWLSDWSHTGDSSIVSTDSPYEGTYQLRLRRATGYVSRAVNLMGRTDVRLQFRAKANGFESGETATCAVSSNGTDWTVVRVWQDGEDDNNYRFEDIDLSSFSMTGQFWIAFDAGMSDTGDYFWVDGLEIVSQAMPSPIVQYNDTAGPGGLIADGSLISGGVYTIEFMNNSGVALVTSAFSSSGDAGNTWVYAQAYKDYLISSTADNSTIIAYVRQSPGSTYPVTGQNIYIESWTEP